jgi:YHS domain-containing protein
MRSGIAFLVLIAACAMLVLAGCDAPEASADAESTTDGTEVVQASNTADKAEQSGCTEACGDKKSEEGCMQPISATAAEGGAEMTTAENKGGECPYAEKAAAEKASAEKKCGGCPGSAKLKTSAADADAMVDLVCGMTASEDSEFSTQHAEATYYFCSGDCRDSFASDPGKYIQ